MSEILDLAQTIDRLLKAENVLLICHKNPDGDTLGSAAALYHALASIGKTVAVICADGVPSRYDYMQMRMFENDFTPEYVVAIDVAGIQLFGDAVSEYTQNIDLCIDHHPSNAGFASALLLDENAAATAEIVYELIDAMGSMGVAFTPCIADCLYTGLATDTGCFKFPNTSMHTHEVAAKLMALGANASRLNSLLFENKSRSRLAVESLALQSLEYHFDDRCALISLTREQIEQTGADITDLEGITGIPRAIEGVCIGVTMRQQANGSYKVSVRAEEGYSASNICANLGGGGHALAAGCEVLGSFENTKKALLAEVERALSTQSTVQAEE